MNTLLHYKWTIEEDNTYHFVTDNYCVYDIKFLPTEQYFDEYCTNCKDILEVHVNCLSNNCPPYDRKVGNTIFYIFQEILSEACNGIIYKCDEKDGRENQRELKFDYWYEIFNQEDVVDKYASELCSTEDCTMFYLLADKGCENFAEIVHNFNFRCESCSNDNEIIEYEKPL